MKGKTLSKAALDLQFGRYKIVLFDLYKDIGWHLAIVANRYGGSVRDQVFKRDGFIGSMNLEFKSRDHLEGFKEDIKWTKCSTGKDGYRRIVEWRNN